VGAESDSTPTSLGRLLLRGAGCNGMGQCFVYKIFTEFSTARLGSHTAEENNRCLIKNAAINGVYSQLNSK
jgi:hypothetical protein